MPGHTVESRPVARTDLAHAGATERQDQVASAVAAAEAVARHAGVSVGPIPDAAGAWAAATLFAEIWVPTGSGSALSPDVIRALAYSGNYVVGAWAGAALVGASVGFVALAHGSITLHSHITGVVRQLRGRQVGLALKLHQRAWALERGIDQIEWSFDPLIRRNAWFNLMRLRAVAVAYHPNFYGSMDDQINAGDESDRCLVCWDLLAPNVVAAGARREAVTGTGRPAGVVLLDVDLDGTPLLPASAPAADEVWLCRIPADIEAQRRADPAGAWAWRLALRRTMGTAMAGGFTAGMITPDGCYVLRRAEAEGPGG